MASKANRSWFANVNRQKRRNALYGSTGRPRQYCATDVGSKVTSELLSAPLAKFMCGESDLKPLPPPKYLGGLIHLLDHEQLALCPIAPIMDGIFRGWGRDDPSVFIKVCEAIGEHIAALLKKTLA
jgi:hypothetical protein